MKIELELMRDSDLAAFADFLKVVTAIPAEEELPLSAQAAKVETKPVEQVAEEPKKTRGKAAAKPAPEPEPQPEPEAKVSAEKATDEPPAITAEEVRNQIIDLLNDWSAFATADPDIRVKTLQPLLKALDATKIGNIEPEKYAMVPALVDESRAKLEEAKAGAEK